MNWTREEGERAVRISECDSSNLKVKLATGLKIDWAQQLLIHYTNESLG